MRKKPENLEGDGVRDVYLQREQVKSVKKVASVNPRIYEVITFMGQSGNLCFDKNRWCIPKSNMPFFVTIFLKLRYLNLFAVAIRSWSAVYGGSRPAGERFFAKVVHLRESCNSFPESCASVSREL